MATRATTAHRPPAQPMCSSAAGPPGPIEFRRGGHSRRRTRVVWRHLAVGAREEDSAATGVNGDQADDSASRAGAIYVFDRAGTRGRSRRTSRHRMQLPALAVPARWRAVMLDVDGARAVLGAPVAARRPWWMRSRWMQWNGNMDLTHRAKPDFVGNLHLRRCKQAIE